MATQYTFNFTDITKTGFTVQAYTANGYLSPTTQTTIPQAVIASTTLKLYGKGMQEYGEGIEQNLIYMLENFANSTRPLKSIEGQLWYNNIGTGSPASGAELFIRNANDPQNLLPESDLTGWDAIILATGNSAMTGELILSGDPVNVLGAVPKQYIDAHAADFLLHLTTEQNTFLDGIALTGSPILTSADVNQLIGIASNVQLQLDDKISRAGDIMDASADLTFNVGNVVMTNGSEVVGLPALPTVLDAAASKLYVDSQLSGGAGGDGVLSEVNWLSSGGGAFDPAFDTLQLVVKQLGLPLATFTAPGISRVGHTHTAADVTYDNTVNPLYPLDLQSVLDYVEVNKADGLNPTFTGTVNVSGNAAVTGTVSASSPIFSNDLATKDYVDTNGGGGSAALSVTRTLDLLSANYTTPTPYAVQTHFAGDNKLSITINGMKQYNNSSGIQNIQYDSNVGFISSTTFTGLDSAIAYDFDISVDGGAPVTVTIPIGSVITTHSELISTINSAMNSLSPFTAATFALNTEFSTVETFTSLGTGSTSSISITDPGSADTYLFATDPSPSAIIDVIFLSNPPPSGSPISNPTPDDIEINGDVTANFPIGKTFTIRGSVDATYGSYDGVYSVHNNGPVFGGVTTLIPIAQVNDSSINESLLPAYDPTGSPVAPAPAPSNFGDAHLTPIGGFDQILTAENGITADYIETDSLGTEIVIGQSTDYVVFNTDITSGSYIETILLG